MVFCSKCGIGLDWRGEWNPNNDRAYYLNGKPYCQKHLAEFVKQEDFEYQLGSEREYGYPDWAERGCW